MMRYLLIVLVLSILVGCGTRKNSSSQQDTSAEDTWIEVPDTLFVENSMVVFLWPDSVEQVVMKERYDENSYNKFVDDLTWYTEKAVKMLDSLKVDNRITDRDIIVLNTGQGEIVYNRKEIQGNMILFNSEKEPVITSMTEYNRNEVREYFR